MVTRIGQYWPIQKLVAVFSRHLRLEFFYWEKNEEEAEEAEKTSLSEQHLRVCLFIFAGLSLQVPQLFSLQTKFWVREWSSQVHTQLKQLRKELKPEKNSGLNGIPNHDLRDAGAVLYQLS